jgi:hypothetical protein
MARTGHSSTLVTCDSCHLFGNRIDAYPGKDLLQSVVPSTCTAAVTVPGGGVAEPDNDHGPAISDKRHLNTGLRKGLQV